MSPFWSSNKPKILGSLVAVMTISIPLPSKAAGIVLGYLDRPGFAQLVSGAPQGAFLPAAYNAVQSSSVPAEWESLPQKRLFDEVKENPNFCAVGIYKTPERATFAKFSEPFYQDRPFVVLTTKDHESQVRAHADMKSLLLDDKIKLGIIEGFSYGNEIDTLIKQNSKAVDAAIIPIDKLIAKLSLGRIDYMLGAPEEIDLSIKRAGVDPSDMVKIEMAATPAGAPRHFMCHKDVSDDVIASLNKGIKK